MTLSRTFLSAARGAAAVTALFLLCGVTVPVNDARRDLSQSVSLRPDGSALTMLEKDLFAMGGDDLNHWPYIEHSSSNGDIQGINFMVPDKSRWGWRFISRITDTNVTVRAQIDVDGNAIFTGNVYGRKMLAGVPGQDTPAGFAWGNRLGGDALSTLFSSSTATVQTVTARVFGISHSGTPVIASDANGNLGVAGNVIAKKVSAKSLQANGSSISAAGGVPGGDCSVGDLRMRTDGAPGATLYSCTAANAWTAVAGGATASSTPLFAQTAFSSKPVSPATPTALGTAKAALGASGGPKNNWYVCSIVEATTEADGDRGARLAFGIGAANAGTGRPFRMYSHPKRDASNKQLSATVVSDWPAVQNDATNGRYCNTYANGATLSFTAYAIAPAAAGSTYTSGQIEIQAIPQ